MAAASAITASRASRSLPKTSTSQSTAPPERNLRLRHGERRHHADAFSEQRLRDLRCRALRRQLHERHPGRNEGTTASTTIFPATQSLISSRIAHGLKTARDHDDVAGAGRICIIIAAAGGAPFPGLISRAAAAPSPRARTDYTG